MKKRARFLGIFMIILLGWVSTPGIVHADVDLTAVKQIELDAQPLDIATSADGTLLFVLAPGEILVHSISKNRVTSRMPVDKAFDRITYSAKDNSLILTSSSSKTLKIIRVDRIYDIDISGLPFNGPENAPVTIATFDDYQ